jgi:hypothetical protein
MEAVEMMKGDVSPKVWQQLRQRVARLAQAKVSADKALEALTPLKDDLPPKVWERIKAILESRPMPRPNPGPNPAGSSAVIHDWRPGRLSRGPRAASDRRGRWRPDGAPRPLCFPRRN